MKIYLDEGKRREEREEGARKLKLKVDERSPKTLLSYFAKPYFTVCFTAFIEL